MEIRLVQITSCYINGIGIILHGVDEAGIAWVKRPGDKWEMVNMTYQETK